MLPSKIISKKLLPKIVVLSLFLLSFSHAEKVAEIGKRAITNQEIDSLTTLIVSAQGGNPSEIPAEQKKYFNQLVLENLIAEELIRLEVVKQKVSLAPKSIDSAFQAFQEQFGGKEKFNQALVSSNQSEKQFKEKLSQELLSQELLKKRLKEIAPPTELEIEDYFKKNKDLFPKNDSLRASQIFLSLEKKSTSAKVKAKTQKLEDIREQLLKILRVEERLIEFSKIAYNSSEGLFKEQGGDMGYFEKNDFVKEFNENVNNLEVGELSKVFQTSQGLHLVLLTTKNNGKYESYRLAIIQAIIQQKSQSNQAKLSEYIQELAKKHNLKVYDSSYLAANPQAPPFR